MNALLLKLTADALFDDFHLQSQSQVSSCDLAHVHTGPIFATANLRVFRTPMASTSPCLCRMSCGPHGCDIIAGPKFVMHMLPRRVTQCWRTPETAWAVRRHHRPEAADSEQLRISVGTQSRSRARGRKRVVVPVSSTRSAFQQRDGGRTTAGVLSTANDGLGANT